MSAAISENFKRWQGVCRGQQEEDDLIMNVKGIDWILCRRDRNETGAQQGHALTLWHDREHTHTHTASTSYGFQGAVAIGTKEGNGHVLERWRGEGVRMDVCSRMCPCVCVCVAGVRWN